MAKTMQVVIPNKLLVDPQKLTKALRNGMRNVAEDVAADFDATTNTWTRKPEFTVSEVAVGQLVVGTTNEIWAMLDAGTKPHDIKPRRAKALRFAYGGKGSFRPKTVPGQLRSNKGRKPTGPIVFRKKVRHPGTKPREWVKTAQEKWEKLSGGVIQRAIDAVVSKD